jgi:hypothetical protein
MRAPASAERCLLALRAFAFIRQDMLHPVLLASLVVTHVFVAWRCLLPCPLIVSLRYSQLFA